MNYAGFTDAQVQALIHACEQVMTANQMGDYTGMTKRQADALVRAYAVLTKLAERAA